MVTLQQAMDRLMAASLELPTKQPFILHDGNREAVEQMAAWLFRLPEYKGDPKRGILLYGDKGTGKSHLMRCASHIMLRTYGAGFPNYKCKDIVAHHDDTTETKVDGERRVVGGLQVVEHYASMKRLSLDDLLSEPMGNWYGKPVNVLQLILEQRGDLMASQPMLTMITTNHGRDKAEQVYGARAADRMDLAIGLSIKVSPNPNGHGFRKTANVLDWMEAPPEEKPSNPNITYAGIIENLANSKNERLKEGIENQRKARVDRLAKMHGMRADDILRAWHAETDPDLKKQIGELFDKRSPVKLSELIPDK